MTTVIRPTLSHKNKYWISKHRYYELKHFCLQYNEWKRLYLSLGDGLRGANYSEGKSYSPGDPVGHLAVLKASYAHRCAMIEESAMAADAELASYIFKAVTQNRSYTYLSGVDNIPCGRDMFYDRYHKFFWLLSRVRE